MILTPEEEIANMAALAAKQRIKIISIEIEEEDIEDLKKCRNFDGVYLITRWGKIQISKLYGRPHHK